MCACVCILWYSRRCRLPRDVYRVSSERRDSHADCAPDDGEMERKSRVVRTFIITRTTGRISLSLSLSIGLYLCNIFRIVYSMRFRSFRRSLRSSSSDGQPTTRVHARARSTWIFHADRRCFLPRPVVTSPP